MKYKLFKNIPNDKKIKGYGIEGHSNIDEYTIWQIEIQPKEKNYLREVKFPISKKYGYGNEYKNQERIFFNEEDIIEEYKNIMEQRIKSAEEKIKGMLKLKNKTDEDIKDLIK